MFCLAIAAALGLDWILSKIGPRWRIPALLTGFFVVMADMFFVSPVVVPVPIAEVKVPNYYYTLAGDKEDYAVFDYPIRRARSELIPEEYFYFQTVHKKSIPFAVNEGWIERDPFWRTTTMFQWGRSPELSATDQEKNEAADFLRQSRFRYFILHKREVLMENIPVFLEFFKAMFGTPVFEDEELIVFRIDLPDASNPQPLN